jgi:hypothetical protein
MQSLFTLGRAKQSGTQLTTLDLFSQFTLLLLSGAYLTYTEITQLKRMYFARTFLQWQPKTLK